MPTLTVLKDYLLGKDGDMGYLLNPEHNGKTVMLSGAWGSGKTHFWQKEIEDDLTKKLNEKSKACVYISLYGKDNIEAIKNEILFKAYESIKDENKLAKRAISAFGFGSRLLSVSVGGVRANTGAMGDAVEGFFESKKIDEAESFLADGGLICLDDFERKSKYIDLNDLFGFIAQLAIDMNCKIVIILNSNVFKSEEANVFKTVKEKTVNKFFYFEPTIKELFDSIYESNKKYEKLDDYRAEILKTIEETEELNARIYIQVLDNCLEWNEKGYDNSVFRVLVISSIYFIITNETLEYTKIHNKDFYLLKYTKWEKYPIMQRVFADLSRLQIHMVQIVDGAQQSHKRSKSEYLDNLKGIDDVRLFNQYASHITRKDKQRSVFSETEQLKHLEWMENHKIEISLFWKYAYRLYAMENISKLDYKILINYIKTGILLENNKEPSS